MTCCAILLLSSYPMSAATRTWTGTASSSWTTAGNWSPASVPIAGDDLVFTQAGLNTSIQNVPSLRLNSMVIQSTGSHITYSFTSGSSQTLSLSGTGNCFSVGSNCSLTMSSALNIDMGTMGAVSSMLVNGSFLVNGNMTFEWGAGQLSIGAGASMTMNGILTYNSSPGLLNVDGTLLVNSALTIPWSTALLTVGTTGSMTVLGAFLYQASGNITINGILTLHDSFTVDYTVNQLIIGTGGSINVTGSFLYESSGNINVNGSMTTNSMEIPWTHSQIIIGNSGSLAVNGPFTYHSDKDFINNGNGTFHINNTYNSNILHTITGSGLVKVDPGQTMAINSDLVIEGNCKVMGSLVVPVTRTLRVNGTLTLKPN